MAQPQKIQILAPHSTNVHEQVSRGSFVQFWNLIYDDAGNIASRPGHIVFSDVSTSQQGYGFWWQGARLIVVASAGALFSIDRFGIKATLGTYPASFSPVRFADDGARLFLTAGGQIFQYDTTNGLAVLTDAFAPTNAGTLTYHGGYLLANAVGSHRIHYALLLTANAGNAQPYQWWSDASGIQLPTFFDADTNPDAAVAVLSAWMQVVVFGMRTIEFWGLSDAGFSPSGQVIANFGIPGSGAFCVVDDTVFAFTSGRDVIRLVNGQTEVVTGGMDADFDAILSPADCEAAYLKMAGGKRYAVFTFPADNKTFAFDIDKPNWYRWGQVAPDDPAQFVAGICTKYAYAQDWNRWLGFTPAGLVLEASNMVRTDGDVVVRSLLRTSFMDGDTPVRKFVARAILALRRGVGTYDEQNPLNTNIAPLLTVRWRSDEQMDWSERILDLGKIGDYAQVVQMFNCGHYRRRQYEIEYAGRAPLAILDFYEETELAAV